jgi:hypothetical protein
MAGATMTAGTNATAGGGSAGAGANGGATQAGGATQGGGSAGGGMAGASPMPALCDSKPVALNPNPFGCKFAWGALVDSSLANHDYLQFATYWIENGMKSDGTFGSCSGCNWVKNNFASSNAIPVYYAYIIGFLGHAAGLEDGNTCPANQPNCPNLTNQGADLVRSRRAAIVQAYASYAKQTHDVWPTKPLLWLLEGDMVQYSGESQAAPLSLTELAELATDITCAIKSNMPNAVVALNHSFWNPDEVTNDFWNAMKVVPYDMVWTTGVANNDGFIGADANATTYNAKTATYQYIHELTGKTIWVDDSCGVSAMSDSWSTSSAATLNERIESGVIAFAHCGSPSSGYQSATSQLAPQLASTCE